MDEINVAFEALDYFEDERGKFYALTPNFELEDQNYVPEETYFIFEVVGNDNDPELIEIEDTDLLNDIAKTFEKRLGMI